MPTESGRFNPEALELRPQVLPLVIAQKFVDGTFLENAPMTTKGDKSEVYALYESPVEIPGLKDASLFVDYRKYHQPSAERTHQIRFEYDQPDPLNPDKQQLIAQMHLGVVDAGTFVLEHRYVSPEFRARTGIGTQLLKTAEGWVQQVADAAHQPMSIRLQTGQDSVMAWVQKQGYVVRQDQLPLLEELQQHPERFLQDNVIVSSESRHQGVVKDVYTFRQGTEGRYMEDAIRLEFQKVLNNVS